MKNNIEITTNKATYTVKLEEQRRVTSFENGQPVWESYTQYNICRDGKMVRFTFQESQIMEMIEFHEKAEANPGFQAHMSSRFD